MKSGIKIVLILFIISSVIDAQPKWKKSEEVVLPELQLFHSNQVVNLPTAETIHKGEWEYEISHRFIPTISTEKAFGGLDGPANIRMGLAYAPLNKLMINVARSNLEDQWDFQIKYKALQFRNNVAPTSVAVRGGLSWAGDVGGQEISSSRQWQYYAQAIVNTMFWSRLGIGIVPSYVYNSHIYCPDIQYSFTTGLYAQYYLSAMWSVYLESNLTVSGFRDQYDSITIGLDIETGGHFFKIFAGNNARINPTQYLSGADIEPGSDNWRLGFIITRVLAFK